MFSKQWPNGLTNDTSTVDGPKLAQLDTNVARSIDGTGGGLYAPSVANIDVRDTNGFAFGIVDILGLASLKGTLVLKPRSAALTGSVNDYTLPANTIWLLLDSNGAYAFSGFAGGADGRIILVTNISGSSLSGLNDNALSAATNRILCLGGADKTLTAKSTAIYGYDVVVSRWRQLL